MGGKRKPAIWETLEGAGVVPEGSGKVEEARGALVRRQTGEVSSSEPLTPAIEVEERAEDSLLTGEATRGPIAPATEGHRVRSSTYWLTKIVARARMGPALRMIDAIIRGDKFKQSYYDAKTGVLFDADTYPTIAQRLEAAKFFVSRGVPLPAAEIPNKVPEGIRTLVLVQTGREPEV